MVVANSTPSMHLRLAHTVQCNGQRTNKLLQPPMPVNTLPQLNGRQYCCSHQSNEAHPSTQADAHCCSHLCQKNTPHHSLKPSQARAHYCSHLCQKNTFLFSTLLTPHRTLQPPVPLVTYACPLARSSKLLVLSSTEPHLKTLASCLRSKPNL